MRSAVRSVLSLSSELMSKFMKKIILSLTAFLTLFSFPALAQGAAAVAAPKVDSGDTAWLIVATALVMLMTIPGLALFYGGLVRRKNILSVLMQCFIITAVISIEWVVVGYSWAFGSSKGALAPFIGGFDWSFLHGIKVSDLSPYFISHSQPTGKMILDATGKSVPEMTGTIPHFVFIMQNTNLMHAITPGNVDLQAQRETFFYNVLYKDHKLNKGNRDAQFLVDHSFQFVIADSDNKMKIKPDYYYAIDKIEVGSKKVIPLWLFGFLY